jgi:hypothetical protein
MACHNGLVAPDGEDVSIGVSWRASMMANSSRDPYWQASVRRETIDHPLKKAAIEDECSICHMPMARTQARAEGREGEVFAHLPLALPGGDGDPLAADGVSCTVCHQIAPDRLGTPESFVGGFVIAQPLATGQRRMFGPFEVNRGRAAMMQSATGVTPAEGTHIQQSEVCATCHTLITQAFGPAGEVVGSIPEQVPYQEWRHSAFRDERSCQSCHMPPVAAPTRVASVLGEARADLSRHTFLGGNFFMLRMLNRYRGELGVVALPQELEASAHATVRQLQAETASLAVERASVTNGRLEFGVTVRNATGHKFPTGYPSRRAWLHVTVRDAGGAVVFESGALAPSGEIAGNDNDADASAYEAHYEAITRPDQVQIYESVMADPRGALTTGLLQATQFVKDNRLLPRGFDKATAPADVAVHGGARGDADFADGADRVRYSVDLAGRSGPYTVRVALRFQPISFRWARNLAAYDADEPRRFGGYYAAMASGSAVTVATANAGSE